MTLFMNPSYYMSILVLTVALCIITLFVIYKKNKKVVEGLEQNQEITIYDDKNLYQENIEDIKVLGITNMLTIYYTCFNDKSLTDIYTGRRSTNWLNISDYFSNNKCPNTQTSDTHLNWSSKASSTPEDGITISTNKGIGPKSYHLGLTEFSDTFSVFFTMKFEAFTQLQVTKTYNLLNIYANNLSNNALTVSFEVLSSSDQTSTSNIKMIFNLGESDTFELPNKPFTSDVVYLFIITKTLDKFDVSIKPNIKGNSYQSDEANDYRLTKDISGTSLHFSNKNIEINKQGEMLPIHIYNFGVYKGGIINEMHKSALATHIYKQFLHFDPLVINTRDIVKNVTDELSVLKECKYGYNVCNICDNISNWADINEILKNATPQCLVAINNYCKENPSESICGCWNPTLPQYETKACKSYRGIFDPDGALNETSCSFEDIFNKNTQISEEQMKEMKKKFNLCDCDIVKAQNEEKTIPLPNLVNKAYDLSKTDMELYDDIVIK